jgi:hypothetical protein
VETSEPDGAWLLTGRASRFGPGNVGGRPERQRCRRAAALTLALGLTAAPVLAACSSASAPAPASAASAVSATCTQVGGALADGPDPDTDPVGYAEAQVKPLRAITTSDRALRVAIRDLATAYAGVFDSDGNDSTVTKAVASASSKVNAICPGAAS